MTKIISLFTCIYLFFCGAQALAANRPDAVLYYKPSCPYCQKVLRYLDSQNQKIPLKDTNNQKYRAELIQIGGKAQVPCLVINGHALYESDDIIAYLKQHPEIL